MADRLTTYVLRALLALTVAALAGAAAAQATGGRYAAATFVVAYLAWVLSEVRITVGTPNRSPAETRTLGIALAGVVRAGVTIRTSAIHQLGVHYSHRVVRISESDLTSSGPYRVLRHPAYAGMLLANIGFAGYFANPASIAALTLLVAAILWRIRVEEDVLVESPGYREFASTRCRILPGVW